ncbi:ribosome small subunit-dependent GTPase A [Glaciihabitans arcticus]|uniref:ribosome small subunit-dependent GTPase A n=1 Tax=Glaciihabitans arcticus TaxID=2668039 RepID=UPI001386DF48|nr:ribosome small subunit-dependent GTPase A [Glaciihabitans arcticus]
MTFRTFPTLEPYGWRDRPVSDGTQPARVLRHDGSTLTAVCADGVQTLRSVPTLEPQPTVGDWLDIEQGTGRIRAVLERSGLLTREAAHKQGSQVLAANVDVVLITCGVDRPIKAGRIQRVATMAWDAGAVPVIVVTKAGTGELDLPRLELEHPGVLVLVTSALEGSGLDAVRDLVAGRTAVLIGESGAGKSTLTNALLGREDAETGRVRASDNKGRHTTTSRQLHLLPDLPDGRGGGLIIDTPGIRSVGLVADAESVTASFAEIGELASSCRFHDCRHAGEPGCAVAAALDDGSLDADRYRDWQRLQREALSAARRADVHAYRSHVKQFSRAAKEGQTRKRGGR